MMSDDDLRRILSNAIRREYGFGLDEVVGCKNYSGKDIGYRLVLDVADGPPIGLFWVKHVVGGKPVGRRYREFATRLSPIKLLDQLAIIG